MLLLFQNVQRTFKSNIPIMFEEMECCCNICIIKKNTFIYIFEKLDVLGVQRAFRNNVFGNVSQTLNK